ncbi:MAG: hypothetical protein H0V82_00650 [Candidatus Protochlamydia sp.]|nr:hypothetical protein [Candidatus Protochlamydia sp.]
MFYFIDWDASDSAQIVDLPPKHLDFLGRWKELEMLKKQLLIKQPGRVINLIALYGEGGIGKTELAISFANDYSRHFSLIAWIDGSTEAALVHSYAKLGDFLNIRDEQSVKQREKIHWYLEKNQRKPWLLIFDDLSDLSFELPKRGGSIIITCRDKSLCPPQTSFELLKNPEEAILLLSKLLGQNPSEQLNYFAEKLDYLPLMINMAGHYVASTPGANLTNYSEILTEIIETEDSPLKWIECQKRYSKSLFSSYLTTLQLLQKKHSLSFEFLQQAAMLHTNSIPNEFLISWLQQQNQFSAAQTLLLMGDILRELQNHSLIRYNEKKCEFSFHQLLHHALALSQQKNLDAHVWLKVLSEESRVKGYNPTLKESILPFQRILPHAIKIIDQVSVADMQAVQLVLTIARYFIETEHQLQKGKFYLDKAQKWVDDWDHPLKGRIAFLQGMLKFRQADQLSNEQEKKRNYEVALAFFDQALDIFCIQNQNDLYQGIEQNPFKCTKDYQRAICMQYQGQTLRVLGQVDEAEKKLEEALDRFLEMTNGKDHFDIARILREQALILWDKGCQDAAITKLENAICMQRSVYGDIYLSQPTVAATHRILGDFYYKRGEYQKAEHAYQFAIQVNQSIYQSETHPYLTDLYHLKAKAIKALRSQIDE